MRTNYITICLRIYSGSFNTWVLIVVKDFSKFAFINFKINKTSKLIETIQNVSNKEQYKKIEEYFGKETLSLADELIEFWGI